MNILYINHYAGGPLWGMEFRPYYFAREWVKAGHHVKIVSASYSHIRAHQPQMEGKDVKDELVDGINYRWYLTPAYKGNDFGRVRNMISFIYQLWCDARVLVNEFKPDIVIASSTYPMDIWPAKRIAQFAGARLVYEVHDLWPLSPMELGGMSRWHPFIMLVQYAEDYAYKHAERVVSILPKTLDYMVSRGMISEKWAYIPNGVQLEEWNSVDALPEDVNFILQRLKSSGLPIVAYAGTHGLANALDLLLDAAALLKGQVEVLLVGTGPERERLLQRVVDERLCNVTMLHSVPKAAIPKLLMQIDVAYIGWHSNPLYRFGICPNKLMDYMMAGKPIVHSVSAGNDPVSEVGCGITVRPGDVIEVTNAIRQMAHLDGFARQQLGMKGQQFVMKFRAYSTLSRQFLEAVADQPLK